MTEPTEPILDRIPIAHSVVYAVRGVPDIADEYNAERTIAPTEITLTYRSTEDSHLGRVHAYVKGWWMQDGQRVPMDKPVGRHMYGNPEAWPEWLAEEARLHDPAGVAPATDRAVVERVRAVLETEAVVGRSALEYRGLIASALMAAEPAAVSGTPCSQPNPCEDGELCATHEEEQAHAEGEHAFCGVRCEVAMPTAPMRNSIVAHGIPGTAGMLDELLRRAAAGVLPAADEPGPDTVAYRDPDRPTALWCRKHGARWWGLTQLTSDDLPDGGLCGECGVDVLIPQEA